MIIIGITGGSGAGKSTLTNIISKKINNSMVINVDEFMHKYLDIHKNEIIKALKLSNINDYWYNYIGTNFNDIKKWVRIIEKDIEWCINDKIMNNAKTEVFIVDWAFLPLISFFDKCDLTISINCDLNIKLKRLSERLEKNNKLSKWHDDALLNRLKYTSLNELGYKTKYQINNDGTIDDLNKKINDILFNMEINNNDN